MRSSAACLTAVGVLCAWLCGSAAAAGSTTHLYAVGFASDRALAAAIEGQGVIVRRVRAIDVAEIRSGRAGFAALVRRSPGVRFVQLVRPRESAIEPALTTPPGFTTPFEWQFAAVHEELVPQSVLRAAASVTIATIDTGADLTAPDLAAKQPRTYNLRLGNGDVRDTNGHGTFVASLAAGSLTNGEGIAGFGGDARLLVVKASHADGSLSDLDEANAIVYAVDHGARVINLSVGGADTSLTERRGIQYAVDHGALVVAAAGNEFDDGNPVEYPSALLQPVGSNGVGGVGLSVGASTQDGSRAFFSNTGSQISLVAPGDDVFGAVSSLSSTDEYPRVALPGSSAGDYGFSSGTSFSAPEVAGVAALVMAANPLLRANEVAEILKETASGGGAWNPEVGYGVADAAAAVERAQGRGDLLVSGVRTRGHVRLRWFSPTAARYRVSVGVDRRPLRVVLRSTTNTAATFTVHRGHRYLFTVIGLGADGSETTSSSYAVRG
jgi:subtilisin family serine protease